jgi:hypothetical protein
MVKFPDELATGLSVTVGLGAIVSVGDAVAVGWLNRLIPRLSGVLALVIVADGEAV